MVNTSALVFGGAAIILCIAIIAGVAGFMFFRRSSWPEVFAARPRRLSCVEKASIDGGRRLLLVRRDDVEHLVMIGGPIDVVLETNIKSPAVLNGAGAGRGLDEARHAGGEEARLRAEPSFPQQAVTLAVTPELSATPSKELLPENEILELTLAEADAPGVNAAKQ